ncbi:MAG: hypothetical protein IKM59_06850 [Oscillospiraceae bacterium]|nr:hypothetical protein [Oscillospiraceae bacterium]
MNTKKLLLFAALCLVLVAALIGYEGGLFRGLQEGDLYGSWLTEIPAEEHVEQNLAQIGITYDAPHDLTMAYEFTFKEDGTVTVRIERESAKKLAAIQENAVREGMPELMYTRYETEGGLSREEADAMLADQGLTMETMVEMTLEQINFEGRYTSEEMTVTQYYCLQDGILCYASTEEALHSGTYDMTVEPQRSGKTLVLSNAFDSEGNPFYGSGGIKYPLTLTEK